MKPILFSIITITYNAGKTLEPTIKSIVSQDYPNIEYIIIDGGSQDETLEIVDKYRGNIHHVVSEPDKGLYDAMNKGMKAASGDYVWFINAGDSLHSDDEVSQIARQLDPERLPDIIYGETAIIDSERRFKGMRRLKAPKKLDWRSFKMGMLVCHQSFIAKRYIAPLYDLKYRFSSDFDWCIKCMRKSTMIHNSNMILSNYLDEGLTTNNRKASLKERLDIMVANYGLITVAALHVWFAIRFTFAKLIGREA